jgi:hypothetical protein
MNRSFTVLRPTDQKNIVLCEHTCAHRVSRKLFCFRARGFFQMLLLSMGRARFAARGLLSCSHTTKRNCQRFIYALVAHSIEANRPNFIVWCEHTCARRVHRKCFFDPFHSTLLSMGRAQFAARELLSCSHTTRKLSDSLIYRSFTTVRPIDQKT